ncbi:DUF1543 domain-containing protein [Aquella oligotrophica]|uniref:DUF1543 domain-containing protein n=1 Tax=Aquella oligotrophica TaxID=2067065 RepID=A0A2I7N6C0_9NEIS|nr:DUF1543 domain-containing protein [Aquella oligotrophica]AUR52017.1 hypothetical protein CUN60_06795 [Aquella oligotrophica]
MKLFIIHVGYYDYDIGMYELHSQFLVASDTAAAAKAKVMAKDVFKAKQMHIDGIQEINQVEGYSLSLQPSTQHIENKIYNYSEIKAL